MISIWILLIIVTAISPMPDGPQRIMPRRSSIFGRSSQNHRRSMFPMRMSPRRTPVSIKTEPPIKKPETSTQTLEKTTPLLFYPALWSHTSTKAQTLSQVKETTTANIRTTERINDTYIASNISDFRQTLLKVSEESDLNIKSNIISKNDNASALGENTHAQSDDSHKFLPAAMMLRKPGLNHDPLNTTFLLQLYNMHHPSTMRNAEASDVKTNKVKENMSSTEKLYVENLPRMKGSSNTDSTTENIQQLGSKVSTKINMINVSSTLKNNTKQQLLPAQPVPLKLSKPTQAVRIADDKHIPNNTYPNIPVTRVEYIIPLTSAAKVVQIKQSTTTENNKNILKTAKTVAVQKTYDKKKQDTRQLESTTSTKKKPEGSTNLQERSTIATIKIEPIKIAKQALESSHESIANMLPVPEKLVQEEVLNNTLVNNSLETTTGRSLPIKLMRGLITLMKNYGAEVRNLTHPKRSNNENSTQSPIDLNNAHASKLTQFHNNTSRNSSIYRNRNIQTDYKHRNRTRKHHKKIHKTVETIQLNRRYYIRLVPPGTDVTNVEPTQKQLTTRSMETPEIDSLKRLARLKPEPLVKPDLGSITLVNHRPETNNNTKENTKELQIVPLEINLNASEKGEQFLDNSYQSSKSWFVTKHIRSTFKDIIPTTKPLRRNNDPPKQDNDACTGNGCVDMSQRRKLIEILTRIANDMMDILPKLQKELNQTDDCTTDAINEIQTTLQAEDYIVTEEDCIEPEMTTTVQPTTEATSPTTAPPVATTAAETTVPPITTTESPVTTTEVFQTTQPLTTTEATGDGRESNMGLGMQQVCEQPVTEVPIQVTTPPPNNITALNCSAEDTNMWCKLLVVMLSDSDKLIVSKDQNKVNYKDLLFTFIEPFSNKTLYIGQKETSNSSSEETEKHPDLPKKRPSLANVDDDGAKVVYNTGDIHTLLHLPNGQHVHLVAPVINFNMPDGTSVQKTFPETNISIDGSSPTGTSMYLGSEGNRATREIIDVGVRKTLLPEKLSLTPEKREIPTESNSEAPKMDIFGFNKDITKSPLRLLKKTNFGLDLAKNISNEMRESFLSLMVESQPGQMDSTIDGLHTKPTAVIIPVVANSSYYSLIKGKRPLNVSVSSYMKRNTSTKPIYAILMFGASDNSLKAFNELRKLTKIKIVSPPLAVNIPKRTKKDVKQATESLQFNFNRFLTDIRTLKNKRQSKEANEEGFIKMAIFSFPNSEVMVDDLIIMKAMFNVDIGPPISDDTVKHYLDFVKD